MVVIPLIPISADTLRFQTRRIVPRPETPRRVLPLQDRHAQPPADMFRNVAVNQPWTGVVGFERNDHVAASGKENDVPARRVEEFEVHGS